MTRDKWLEKCGRALMADGDIDAGEAAAIAEELAEDQRSSNGRSPACWDSPEKAGAEFLAGFAAEEGGTNG